MYLIFHVNGSASSEVNKETVSNSSNFTPTDDDLVISLRKQLAKCEECTRITRASLTRPRKHSKSYIRNTVVSRWPSRRSTSLLRSLSKMWRTLVFKITLTIPSLCFAERIGSLCQNTLPTATGTIHRETSSTGNSASHLRTSLAQMMPSLKKVVSLHLREERRRRTERQPRTYHHDQGSGH